MELIKRNIHMDRTKTQAVTQFTLEDDINIPDTKPDVNALNLEKGELVIEEIKPGNDAVTVRGTLRFVLLYHTLEEGSSLVVLEGRLPFEEKMNLRGAASTDTVTVDGEVEDLTVGMINSRKLNVQSLITLTARVEELYDEEAPIAIHGDEKCEYRRMPLNIAQIAICKNDIFRLKEEVTLPSNYPNIFQILWDNISLGDVEFKVMEEKLTVSGDVHLFVLYEGEGEEHPVRSFETTIPFSGVLECHGCKEGMLPDIRYRIGQKELMVRPDFDGEERSIGMELVLDIGIRIYEEENLEIISDIYGVSNEIETVSHRADLRRLLSRVTGKTKVTDHIHVAAGSVLQLLHSEGTVMLEQQSIVETGILLQGSMQIKVLYITGEDEAPYGCAQAQLPYQYTLEVPDIAPEDMGKVRAEIEQLQVTMLDGEEMDVKAVLSFSTAVFKNIPVELIGQVKVGELDSGKMSSLPGMVVYMVKEGDNLWNIGKKYYVPVDTLRELNALESDELKAGQKLLIVKGS
ncbi:MAG: SPOCS domain-containing protein [Acetatifactor sp.]